MSGQITLNDDQANAVEVLITFMTNTAKNAPKILVFQGSAGVGKSTTIQRAVERYTGAVALTAPTNKAAKVLRQMAIRWGLDKVKVSTIYKILGLVLKTDAETPYVQSTDKTYAPAFQVIVIDEGYMMGQDLFDHLMEQVDEYGFKVIIMGDPCQIPPVKEEKSPVSDLTVNISLTKVMRHDNQILTVATHLRECIGTGQLPIIAANNDESGGVWTCNSKSFMRYMEEAFTSDTYENDSGSVRVIAWRNNTVDAYNRAMRKSLYGKDCEKPFHLGERVVVCKPAFDIETFKKDPDTAFVEVFTDDEGVVERVEEVPHPIHDKILCSRLQLDTDDGKGWHELFVCHPDSQRDLDAMLSDLAASCKRRHIPWKVFWDTKALFHDVRPCHAITAHRSQGSTYDTVLVDVLDIQANPNVKEMMQCLYVACSRASRILIARTR